jgi:hypothetical protein
MGLYQPSLSCCNLDSVLVINISSYALIFGLEFRISIPFRNPHAGVHLWRMVGNQRPHSLFMKRWQQEVFSGKPGLEDLQLRFPRYKGMPWWFWNWSHVLPKGNFLPSPFLSHYPLSSTGNFSQKPSCRGGGVNGFSPFPSLSLFLPAIIGEYNMIIWLYP